MFKSIIYRDVSWGDLGNSAECRVWILANIYKVKHQYGVSLSQDRYTQPHWCETGMIIDPLHVEDKPRMVITESIYVSIKVFMESWLKCWKNAETTEMSAALRRSSGNADSRPWESFRRSGVRLESPHTYVFRKWPTAKSLVSRHSWTRDDVRGVLPGLRRKRTGLLLSGPKWFLTYSHAGMDLSVLIIMNIKNTLREDKMQCSVESRSTLNAYPFTQSIKQTVNTGEMINHRIRGSATFPVI